MLPDKEFRRMDLNSEELGVPVQRLMQNAGKALAAAVEGARKTGPVTFLCGKGNNGGDGFAAACELTAAGRECIVVLLEGANRVRGREARHYLQQLPKEAVVRWGKHPRRAKGVVVDCLLGSGIRGKPRPPYDAAIRWINRQNGPVIACDVPSGLGNSLAVRPQRTVTFHAAKEGMTRQNSGTIQIANIGIPKAAERRIGMGDLIVGYPRPQDKSHKGENGTLLIVGGGPFTGAPHYAGMAAYRTGCDLVIAAIPTKAANVVQSYGPDLIVHEAGTTCLDDDGVDAVGKLLPRASALLIGPGLGTGDETRAACKKILEAAARAKLPTVVDADGLDAVDATILRRLGNNMILSPHAQEFKDLTRWKATPTNVQRFARENKTVVLCKGKVDHVADQHQRRECHRGHPTMTVGGTGDVLAGAAAALLAKGSRPFDAACAAAYLVGRAGELAAGLKSYGATATDVAEAIPAVLLQLEQQH